jgi:hypothetical protein
VCAGHHRGESASEEGGAEMSKILQPSSSSAAGDLAPPYLSSSSRFVPGYMAVAAAVGVWWVLGLDCLGITWGWDWLGYGGPDNREAEMAH